MPKGSERMLYSNFTTLPVSADLPKEWYDREKLGFPVPIKKWLREEKFYTSAPLTILTSPR